MMKPLFPWQKSIFFFQVSPFLSIPSSPHINDLTTTKYHLPVNVLISPVLSPLSPFPPFPLLLLLLDHATTFLFNLTKTLSPEDKLSVFRPDNLYLPRQLTPNIMYQLSLFQHGRSLLSALLQPITRSKSWASQEFPLNR